MSESFDDMMRRELGDDFGVPPDLASEMSDLFQRFGMPPQVGVYFMKLTVEVLTPLAQCRVDADRWEAEGLVPSGFRRAPEALIATHVTRLTQCDDHP